MVAQRRIPSAAGWRRLLYSATLGAINLGESKSEKHYRDLRERVRKHVRKQYVIAVVSGKGGTGKTTITACIGGVLRQCRSDNIVAVDAVPGFGTLACRIDERPPGDYTAILNDDDMQGYADIRDYLGQNAVGLDVLARDQTPDQPRPLTPAMFNGVLSRLRRTHSIVVVDTADDVEHAAMKAVLDSCHTVVLVAGLTADTSLPVIRAVDCLRSLGYHDLVSRSVIVLNDHQNRRDGETRAYLTERFKQFGAAVEFMPYDRHLAEGGIIDTLDQLSKPARLRLFEITAAIVDKYVSEAERTR